jgi:hypothetical protein
MDWDEDWIFYDSRFGLADSDDALVRFLAEMLHPAVRTDLAEAEELRSIDRVLLAGKSPDLRLLSVTASR